MKVLIVAKTRMGGGVCIGAITGNGKSVRLIPFNEDLRDGANRGIRGRRCLGDFL